MREPERRRRENPSQTCHKGYHNVQYDGHQARERRDKCPLTELAHDVFTSHTQDIFRFSLWKIPLESM